MGLEGVVGLIGLGIALLKLVYDMFVEWPRFKSRLQESRQIDEILELLSNPVLDVLVKENGGYVLTLPPSAARRRLEALAGLLAGEE